MSFTQKDLIIIMFDLNLCILKNKKINLPYKYHEARIFLPLLNLSLHNVLISLNQSKDLSWIL